VNRVEFVTFEGVPRKVWRHSKQFCAGSMQIYSFFLSFFLSFFIYLFIYLFIFWALSTYLLTVAVEGYFCTQSHSMTHTCTVGLLWTRDRPVAKSSVQVSHTDKHDQLTSQSAVHMHLFASPISTVWWPMEILRVLKYRTCPYVLLCCELYVYLLLRNLQHFDCNF
jgi:hypothetical protein